MGNNGMASPMMPMRGQPLGLPQLRGRGPRRSPIPQVGPAMPRPGGLQMYADGGQVDMGDIMRDMSLHSMPNRALPEYLMARMADGGEPPDPFYMPMHRSIDEGLSRRRAERNAPRMEMEAEPLDMEELRGMLRPEREMSYLRARPISGRDRQRSALYDMYNADATRRMEDAESMDTWSDVAGSLLDPTQLPLMTAGIPTRLLSKLAPSIGARMSRAFPAFRGSMPWKARAGEFGAWGTSGPNVGEVGGDDDVRRRFGFRDLPRDLRMIGDR